MWLRSPWHEMVEFDGHGKDAPVGIMKLGPVRVVEGIGRVIDVGGKRMNRRKRQSIWDKTRSMRQDKGKTLGLLG